MFSEPHSRQAATAENKGRLSPSVPADWDVADRRSPGVANYWVAEAMAPQLKSMTLRRKRVSDLVAMLVEGGRKVGSGLL